MPVVDVSARARRHAARVQVEQALPDAQGSDESRAGWFGDSDFEPGRDARAPVEHAGSGGPTARLRAVRAAVDTADPWTGAFRASADADPLSGPTGRFVPPAPRTASPSVTEPATETELDRPTGRFVPPAPRTVGEPATETELDPPTAPIRVVPGSAAGASRASGTEESATDRFAAVPAAGGHRHRRAPEPGRPAGVLARAAVLTVLLALLGGGATALTMDKTVTLVVDGSERTLHTFASDVGTALASAGLVPTPQDRISPAPPTELVDGDQIIIQRARPLTLVEGGSERQVWTTANSVDEALQALGVEVQPIQMSAAPGATIPLTGMALELRVPRAVTFTDGTGAPTPVTTTAGTVAGLLAEHGIELGPDDVAVPSGDTPLEDGGTVQVVRNGIGEVVETRRIPPPEQVIEDPDMPRGEKEVVEEGKPGEQTAVMRVHVQNGREVRREQVRAGGSTPPQPRVIRVGTNDEAAAADEAEYGGADAPAVSDESTWEKLADCEATGNWAINTGNGYFGGLQFDARTWKAYGGDAYAALPHQASPEEQMAVATKVRDDRGGYGAWPACARKLGLPR